MRGLAGELQHVVARALALEFERAAGARLQDEHGLRLSRLGANEIRRGHGSDLLITGDEDRQTVQYARAEVVGHDRGRVHAHDRPGEHVEAAGTAQDAVLGGEREAFERAVRPHRVLMVEQDDAGGAGAEAQAQVGGAVDLEQFRLGTEAVPQERGEVPSARGHGRLVVGRSLEGDDPFDVGEHVGQASLRLFDEVGRLGRG